LLRVKDVDLRAIYLARDGVTIELLHYASPGHTGDASPRPMNGLGLTHLSLRVEDLEALAGGLEKLGGRTLRKTWIEIPEARTKVIFLTDPDGTLIELVERPGG
jgi:glyoxylase I family protein